MLLKKILDRMTQGGTWTIDSLARELDTTPLLVEMMVQDLERRGHLKRVTGNCGGACASCAAANGCLKESSQKMWALVKKAV